MKKKARRIILFCLVAATGVILSLIVYIQKRTGPDYVRHFARLMPPETAAFVSLRDFSGLWDQASSLGVYHEIMESDELGRVLISSDDYREWKNQLSEIEYKTRMQLGRDFLLKWMGQELAAAIVPPSSPDAPPSILVMSRTRIGFEEKLAEFVAGYYPDLNLERQKFKNVTINRYKGKENTRSFSYLRFGRTVFLTIRSPDTTLLKRIVDLKNDRSLPRLYDREDFRNYLSILPLSGNLSGYVNPASLTAFLEASQKQSDSESLKENLPLIHRGLSPYRFIHVEIHLDKGLHGAVRLYHRSPREIIPPPRHYRGMNQIPADASVFLGLKDHRLGETLHEFSDTFFRKETYTGDEPEFFPELHLLLERHILPDVKNEILVSLNRMEPGFISPLFDGDLLVETRDSSRSEKTLTRLMASMGTGDSSSIITPAGTIGSAMEGDFAHIRIRGDAEGEKSSRGGSSLSRHPLFQSLFSDLPDNTRLVLYINFDRVSDDLENLAKRSIRWNEKTRKRIKRFEKWASVCRYLGGCAVRDDQTPEATLYKLYIPLE